MNETQQEFEFAKDFQVRSPFTVITPDSEYSQEYLKAVTAIQRHNSSSFSGAVGIGPLQVKFQKIHPDAVIPKKAHNGDVGYDLTAVYFEKKDFTVIAHTGLKMELPVGYEGQVRSRSGLASNGIVIANSPGSIDNFYRGEILVILGSVTGRAPEVPGVGTKECKIGNVELASGDRVAQLVIAPIVGSVSLEVEEVSEATDRGSGGLGSTGR